MVVRRPRTARELADKIWSLYPEADRPHLSCIKAHIHWANRKLCYRGKRIHCQRRGLGRGSIEALYAIEMVKPHAYPKRKPARNQNAAGMEGA
jgi:hypothetical protein